MSNSTNSTPRRGEINLRLVIFLAIVLSPILCIAYVFVAGKLSGGIEQHAGYAEVDLKELGNFPLNDDSTINDVPARWKGLDGKRVLLQGFMYAPNSAGGDVSNFQFVYNRTKCCFSGPPQVQERVFVRMPKGSIPYDNDMVKVTGTLHVDVVKDGGKIISVYTLDLEKVDQVS
jgi:hypothetical protein